MDIIDELIQKDIKINKDLCEKMPYLIPRSAWTGEIVKDYDYTYIVGDYEIPEGWHKLFLQMCEEILPILEENKFKEKYRFIQVKEKYGALRVYDCGAPFGVHEIIGKYEHISRYVCHKCGKPANFISNGYILPYCDNCKKECATGQEVKFDPILKIEGYSQERGDYIDYIDCRKEWKKLYE